MRNHRTPVGLKIIVFQINSWIHLKDFCTTSTKLKIKCRAISQHLSDFTVMGISFSRCKLEDSLIFVLKFHPRFKNSISIEHWNWDKYSTDQNCWSKVTVISCKINKTIFKKVSFFQLMVVYYLYLDLFMFLTFCRIFSLKSDQTLMLWVDWNRTM